MNSLYIISVAICYIIQLYTTLERKRGIPAVSSKICPTREIPIIHNKSQHRPKIPVLYYTVPYNNIILV